VQSEAVDLLIADPAEVAASICGSPEQVILDIGCGHSVMKLSVAKRLIPALSTPGSSVQLLQLDEAVRLGLFASDVQCNAMFVLRNVPVDIGSGRYRQHFLVMKEANFDITLGLDFFAAYAGKFVARNINDRQSGKFLMLPVPPQYVRPGHAPPQVPSRTPAHLRPTWVPQQFVPVRFLVHRHRCRGRCVPLSVLQQF
jgi:hypothetical protein